MREGGEEREEYRESEKEGERNKVHKVLVNHERRENRKKETEKEGK